MNSGLISAGIILYYLNQTQHDKLGHILNIKRIDREDYVWMDRFTILNLEIFKPLNENGKSLLDVLNKTLTPIGSRMLRRWIALPLVNQEKIENRLDIVDFLIKNETLLEELCAIFNEIGDLSIYYIE